MDEHRKYTLGEIYVFKFSEFNPNDFAKRHPVNTADRFVVYNGNGNPVVCSWQDGAFWHRWGETDADWEIVMSVQMWFRIPTEQEIADGSEVQEEQSNV